MVEQDVSVEDQDPDVEDEEARGQAGGGEGVGEVPHGEEAEWDHGAAEQRAAAPHAEEGVVVVEVPGLLEGVGAVVSRAVSHLLPCTIPSFTSSCKNQMKDLLNSTVNQSLMTYLFWFPSLLKPLNSAAAFLEAARPGLDLVIDYT